MGKCVMHAWMDVHPHFPCCGIINVLRRRDGCDMRQGVSLMAINSGQHTQVPFPRRTTEGQPGIEDTFVFVLSCALARRCARRWRVTSNPEVTI